MVAKAGVARFAERSPVSPGEPSSGVSAEESVKNWLAYRENQTQLPANESPNQWLAFREKQKQKAATSPTIETGHGDGEESKGSSHRGPKNDLGL